MNTKFRKFIAATMTACAICSIGVLGANAAGPVYDDGDYTAQLSVMHATEVGTPSMGRIVYDHDVDIHIQDGQAQLQIYSPYGEAVKALAPNGPINSLSITVGDQVYQGVSDITTQQERCFEEAIEFPNIISIPAGSVMASQCVTVTIPVEALDAAADTGLMASANVIPMGAVEHKFVLSDITKAGAEAPQATEASQHSLMLSADVAAPEASYTVEIPEVIALGTLSAEQDNTTAYTVPVTAKNLGAGHVEVSAPAEGALSSANSSLAYTNSFGTQSFSQNGQLSGSFTVTAADVASAAAGNYTGTVLFDISYFAA